MPILNSTLIIVVSFVPLFFLSGMEGRMLIPLGISFIVALFASTIVALTLTPVLCSYLLGGKKNSTKVPKEAFVAAWLKKHYRNGLNWALNHKAIVGGSTLALFAAALGLFFTLGHSFLPPFNEGSFTINVSSLPGISLEESDRIGRRAEELLLTIPEIQTVARKTGRAELDEHALGVNVSEIEAPFVLKDRSHAELLDEVREKLSTISGANIEIGQPISHRIDAMLSGTQASIAIKLFGDNLNEMFVIGNRIKSAISGVEGIADLNVEQQIERPELKITPKRDMLARYGISLPAFAEFVTVNMAGETVSQVYEEGKTFNLVVRASEDNRGSMEHIRDLMIDDANGNKIPLSYVADVESSMGPNTINRENVKRKVVISANTRGRDLRSVVNDIQDIVDAEIVLPEGYHIEYGGQFESEQAASRTLLLTSLMSIVVIFLLLYMELRRTEHPGHHRLHRSLRHRDPQRHAADQPLQPPAYRGASLRPRVHPPRLPGSSQPDSDDGPLLGPRHDSTGHQRRPARQRDPEPHGQGHPRRTAHLHPAQRLHRADSLRLDAPPRAQGRKH